MITFERDDVRFTYRVAGVALHNGRVLLQQDPKEGLWILPGGRAELLEPAAEGLRREMMEELATEVAVVRLLWVVENFFDDNGGAHHEVGLYFLMTFPDSSPLYRETGPIEAREEGVKLVCWWQPLEELDGVDLKPSFLVDALRAIPESTQHVVHRDG